MRWPWQRGELLRLEMALTHAELGRTAAEGRVERLETELLGARTASAAAAAEHRSVIRAFAAERAQTIASVSALARGYGSQVASLVATIAQLRREGFNPLEPAISPPLTQDDRLNADLVRSQKHEQELRPVTDEDRRGWLLITEAIQSRAGDQPELAGRITEDAHRWRGLGVPHAEIAKRIYRGEG